MLTRHPYRAAVLAFSLLTVCCAMGLRLAAPPVIAEPVGVVWSCEAEAGQIIAPMVAVWDESASGCAYVHSLTREGSATFFVDVPTSGSYYVWGRVAGMEAYLNSFYVSFDGGAETTYEIQQFDGVWGRWGWDAVREKHGKVVPFTLTQGRHVLRFRPREAQARLDRLLLTDDPAYVPSGQVVCRDPSVWTVLCLGDSITHGYPYAGTAETYPARLQALMDDAYGPQVRVVNRGVDGYRADEVLSALSQWLELDPDFVLVMAGGNDLAQEVLPDSSNFQQVVSRTVAEVQAIVNAVRQHTRADGSRPHVLVSTYTPTQDFWQCLRLAEYNARLRQELTGADMVIHSNWETLYDPLIGRARPALMADTLHPNAEGYALLAENWLAAVQRFAANVPLSSGWNLISLPLVPVSDGTASVLKGIESSCDLVYAYDQANASGPWRRYVAGAFLPSATSLARVDPTMGLWVRATRPVSLTVRGWTSPPDAIRLDSGWSLVGYPWPQPRPLPAALASLGERWDVVFAYDAANPSSPWRSHARTAPAAANDLHEMAPGRGYWLHLNSAADWALE